MAKCILIENISILGDLGRALTAEESVGQHKTGHQAHYFQSPL